ncbi:MAG: sigma-70 family RNA polymerase sigma factor [Polyangiaceae bacterium]|nr:sigma-70 family RNA polymerase sigma factor [Polyangiaceae bacterium]
MTTPVSASLALGHPSSGTAAERTASLPTYDQIYEEHFQVVWRALRRLRVPESSLEDATQDVFVVVHRQLPGFLGNSSLRTWILGIAVRVASDWRRRRRRRPTEELPPEVPAGSEGPLEQAARSEAVTVLYELLDKLPERQRTVFVLAELEELSTAQIAELLQERVHTVKSRLQAARRSFEAALSRHHARDRWRQP